MDGETVTPLVHSEYVNFEMDAPTVGAGSLLAGKRIIQAYPDGVRVYDGCATVQEFVTDDGFLACPGEKILYVTWTPFSVLAVLTSMSSVHLASVYP